MLVKCATFLEALTAYTSMDARIRPVYEKSSKIGEHFFFILQTNELFGILPMITTILLSRIHKPSEQGVSISKLLP